MGRKAIPYRKLKPHGLSDNAWAEIVYAWENGLSDREASFRACRDGDTYITEAELKEIVESSAEISGLRDFLRSALVSQAKLNISESINQGNVSTAKWYLERRADHHHSPVLPHQDHRKARCSQLLRQQLFGSFHPSRADQGCQGKL